MLESVPFFLQPGVKILNKGSIEFANDSKVVAAATSSSSYSWSCLSTYLYLDEFAFVENAEEFYTATYPVVTSGKDSKVIITSTANGVGNMFYKIYESAVHKQSEYKSLYLLTGMMCQAEMKNGRNRPLQTLQKLSLNRSMVTVS